MRKENLVKGISILTFGSIVSSACAEEITPTPYTAADNSSSPTVEVNPTILPATKEVFETPIKISPTPIRTDVFIEPTKEKDEAIRVSEIPFDPGQKVPILEYHNPTYGIGESATGPVYMTKEIFKSQLATLREMDFYTPTEGDLLGWLEGKHGLPKRSVILRVDMGVPRRDYEEGFELLDKYGFRAILFIVTGAIPEESTDNLVGWDSIKNWVDKGVLIPGSHGTFHPNYTEIPVSEAVWDAVNAKEEFEKRLGVPVYFFAFPYDAEAHEGAPLEHFKMLFGNYSNYASAQDPLVGTLYPYIKHGDFDLEEFRESLISITEGGESLLLNEKVSDILSRIEPLSFDSQGNLVILDEAEDTIAKPFVVIPTNESQEKAKKGELVDEVRLLVVHSDGAPRLKSSGVPRTALSTLAGLNSNGVSTHWSIDEFPIRLEHEGEGGFGILSTQSASGDASRPYEGAHVLIGIEIKTGRADVTRINTVDIFKKLGIESNLIDLVDEGTTDLDKYSVGFEQIGWYLSRNFPENFPPNQQIANVLSLTLANMEQYLLTPWDIVGHHEIQEKRDPGDEFMAVLRFLIGVAALEEKISRDLVFEENESDVEYFLLVGNNLRERVSDERFRKWDEFVGYSEFVKVLGHYQ